MKAALVIALVCLCTVPLASARSLKTIDKVIDAKEDLLDAKADKYGLSAPPLATLPLPPPPSPSPPPPPPAPPAPSKASIVQAKKDAIDELIQEKKDKINSAFSWKTASPPPPAAAVSGASSV